MVFSQRDYDLVKSAAGSQFLQQLATLNFTFVFVGCGNAGLADDNVGALLDWFSQYWIGLGKKHYVLVRDSDLEAGWRDAVTPIVYGSDYPELVHFLEALAPPRAPERAPFPPDPKMIGRGEQLKEVVNYILTGDRPIIVPGGPGMGKTTLALAASHNSRVRAKFGAARVFVDLQAVASADALLRALASALGVEITGATVDILASLAGHVASTPTVAILDNLETPWHAEAIKTEDILGQLAGIDGLHLVITVRGETPRVSGGARKLGDIERLGVGNSRELFLRDIDPKFAKDPALPELLEALDGHPLSIVLMSAQTDGRRELAGLMRDWSQRRADVLARGDAKDRLTSVRVSLELSIAQLAADARRLLGLVALLPTGLQEEDVAALLPGVPAAENVAALVKARLVEVRGARLTMLAPLRETAREEELAAANDKVRLIAHFLSVARDGDKIGTDAWPSVRDRVTREAGNLDAICMAAIDNAPADREGLEILILCLRGLAELHRFGVPAEVQALHQVLALGHLEAVLPLKAECGIRLGAIALARSEHDAARTHLHAAKLLYESLKDKRGEANCIRSFGDIALDRSEYASARTCYEEAEVHYERIGHQQGQANCIQRLGDIALKLSDHDNARARYEDAHTLYERIGDQLGQANCTRALGEIARALCDYESARSQFNQAYPLYTRIGDFRGEANCLKGLGDIALARSDYETARNFYKEAKTIYERIGALGGQANCIQSLGDVALARSDHDTARARFEEALALYKKFRSPIQSGLLTSGSWGWQPTRWTASAIAKPRGWRGHL